MDTPLLALTRRRLSGGPTLSSAEHNDNMRQLIQLRWLAVAGQCATVLVCAYLLHIPLPVTAMLAVIAAAAVVNLLSAPLLRRHQVRQGELLLALLFDVGTLTLQLYLSGGASNPFVALFLLQVVLGAILLERWASWVIVGVTGVSYAGLIAWYLPLRYPPNLLSEVGGLRLLGSWLCFAMVGVLLVLFVTRIIRNLRVRDARVAELRARAAQEDHLVRLGLFASGAAHELGTPLATLSVILSDWRREPALAADPALAAEIAEMQAEVQRCKAIVTDVLHSVGELREDAPDRVAAAGFLAETVAAWRALHPTARLSHENALDDRLAIAADPALRQAIWNVLDNAAEVSPDALTLTSKVEDDVMIVAVADRGPGFAAQVLAEVGNPQRSRKGAGHGVGLFLVASVVRKLGGTLAAANRPGGGAAVTIRLPLASIGIAAP
ncbi:ATP-binding protein [Sphingomonas sp.]|jgi:two-component system sensor histidine kinase RegB|uniref:ATP-binding protein n=1 Tax=Sphingomonas sp. TaxID=28214 RepID=UPI002D80A0CC|nr:ATP-binding protein [Sphingomonas sp.]HEU0045253.1 ATP-binding protein [Sphingomonas sp.]